jgi:hypothetical protein
MQNPACVWTAGNLSMISSDEMGGHFTQSVHMVLDIHHFHGRPPSWFPAAGPCPHGIGRWAFSITMNTSALGLPSPIDRHRVLGPALAMFT